MQTVIEVLILKRDFCAEMCRVERWSERTLRHKIGQLLFERTDVAKRSDKVIKQDLTLLRDEDRMTPEPVFQDPYSAITKRMHLVISLLNSGYLLWLFLQR